jgi:hypothetical protein
VQNEASQYEIPAHRLQVAFEGKRVGEGKSLGEAVVVNTLFGKARVRIIHENDNSGWLWPAAILVLLGTLAAIWWWQGAPKSPRPDRVIVLPSAVPPASAPGGQVPRNIPLLNNPVEPPATVKEQPAPSEPQVRTVTEEKKPAPQLPARKPVKKEEAGKVPAKKAPAMAKPVAASKPKARPAAAANDELTAHQVKQQEPAETPVAIQPSATPTALQPSIQITRNPSDQPPADSTRTAPPADNTQQPAAQP